MSLVDIMSGMKLHVYAEVALVIFLVMFLVVVFHVFRKHNAKRFDKSRFMPLDDDNPQELRDPHEHNTGHHGRQEGVEG